MMLGTLEGFAARSDAAGIRNQLRWFGHLMHPGGLILELYLLWLKQYIVCSDLFLNLATVHMSALNRLCCLPNPLQIVVGQATGIRCAFFLVLSFFSWSAVDSVVAMLKTGTGSPCGSVHFFLQLPRFTCIRT